MTNASVSYLFFIFFTHDLYNTRYITYFMAPLFYAFLVPLIVVGVLLTCQSLDPEYKTTAFFSDVFPRKNIVLYSGQYGTKELQANYSTTAKWINLIKKKSRNKKNLHKVDFFLRIFFLSYYKWCFI